MMQALYPNPARIDRAYSVDEAVHIVGNSLAPHRLRIRERMPAAVASLSTLDLGDCALVHLKYGFEVEIDAGVINDHFMVKWGLAGMGHVMSGERVAATSPQAIVVTSPQERSGFRMSAVCQHLTTRVSRKALEERLMQKLGRRLLRPVEFDLEMATDSDFGRAWCQLVTHICQISAAAPTVLECEEVRKQYSRTMIELMIHAAPHNYSQEIQACETQTMPWYVRRAQVHLEAHLSEVRSVADLAAAIGITPRTLQNGFREALKIHPAEYIRSTRVMALHRALLAVEPGQTVTSAMLSVGITSFGRYAEYYRQQFGQWPSETLRRAL
jgi:AraC-like DNA-binding protein